MSITNIETLIDKIKVLKDFNDTDEILFYIYKHYQDYIDKQREVQDILIKEYFTY